jgi:hypothetical protein
VKCRKTTHRPKNGKMRSHHCTNTSCCPPSDNITKACLSDPKSTSTRFNSRNLSERTTTLVFSSWETLQSFCSAAGLRPPTGWETVPIAFAVVGSPQDVDRRLGQHQPRRIDSCQRQGRRHQVQEPEEEQAAVALWHLCRERNDTFLGSNSDVKGPCSRQHFGLLLET